MVTTVNMEDQQRIIRGLFAVSTAAFALVYLLVFVFASRVSRRAWRILSGEKARLKVAEEFKNTIQVLPNAVYRLVKDNTGEFIIAYNEGSIAEKFNKTTDQVKGQPFLQMISEEHKELATMALEKAFSGELAEFLSDIQGRTFIHVVSPTDRRDRQGRVVEIAGFATDVTEKVEAQEQMRYMAYHDSLTGLPNRTVFIRQLNETREASLQSGLKMAVLFLDLDRFKLVNDTVGHVQGDRLLVEVAERLKETVGPEDLVARLSGDEFIVLLSNVQENQQVNQLAEKIIGAFNRPFELGGLDFYITTSIGIAVYPCNGESAEELIMHADIALYRAKHKGKNSYQYYQTGMDNYTVEKLEMEKDLRLALDYNEFVVYYQPQVQVGTRQVTGVEALVRWQHPTRGLVSPARFIPLAEETGLIIPIGEWVLREACRQHKQWIEEGAAPLRISVNLSGLQFRQKHLVDMVQSILLETGMDPDLLTLEITESVSMQDIDHTNTILKQLRALGLHIAIDDFGTGYSSLNYLKYFPITTLKIDKSFIGDLYTDQNGAAVVKAIIALGQSLNLKIVAEGVETEEQLGFLRELGCHEMQGYLVTAPIPADDLSKGYLLI